MPNAISSTFSDLTTTDLQTVTGGAGTSGSGGLDLDAVRAKAQSYCPDTAAKYANVKSSTLTRGKALKMGNECLDEMGPFYASFARRPMMNAIDDAFPRTTK